MDPTSGSGYGELAALGTALCWTTSSIAFSKAGRQIGSLVLNLVRLVIAFVYLTIFCWIYRGKPLPVDATFHAWTWLCISGMVGFVIGDLCLFRAFVVIGPRISALIMALAPPIAATIGWLVLDERLSAIDCAGMLLTLSGIVWVVLERKPGGADKAETYPPSGIALAFLGAVGQAGGLVLSKKGMGDYDAFAATQIRILAGIAGFSLLFFVVRWWGRVLEGIKHRAAMGFAALGAFAGPFLGVSLSLVAVQHTQTGVAATIMAMVPVLIIPPVMILEHEKVSLRAVAGAFVAVGGVAMLWLG